MSVFGAHASPCTSTGSTTAGRAPSVSGLRPTQDCAVKAAGKSSMGIAWIARSPCAIARIASGRRARHSSPTAQTAGQRRRHQPLRVLGRAVREHARGRMPRPDPLEALPLPLQVDAGAARIPLHEAVPDPEGQPAEFVAPDEFGLVVAGDLEHDRWDRVVAERVKLREKCASRTRASFRRRTPPGAPAPRRSAVRRPGRASRSGACACSLGRARSRTGRRARRPPRRAGPSSRTRRTCRRST